MTIDSVFLFSLLISRFNCFNEKNRKFTEYLLTSANLFSMLPFNEKLSHFEVALVHLLYKYSDTFYDHFTSYQTKSRANIF